jgi:hypothetical protein
VSEVRAEGVVEVAGQAVPDVLPDLFALWSPRFPSAERVAEAAAAFPARPVEDGRAAPCLVPDRTDPLRLAEGPRFRIVVGPGVLALERRDLAKRERTVNREADHRAHAADQAGLSLAEGWPDRGSRREVAEWSRKSRARMTRRLADLDWAPLTASRRLPAMVTLTYPGEWEVVCPDGPAVKAHLLALMKRWERAWSEPFVGAWKLEFQDRGAPHFHLYCCPPLDGRRAGEGRRRPSVGDGLPFKPWLSLVWADIVAHPDPQQYVNHLAAGTGVDIAEGLRGADPKRIAIYFTKHGMYASKEYQHVIPRPWREPGKGPGRFWGYRGLRPATVTGDLALADYDRCARTLRRWARAQGLTREVWAPRGRRNAPQSAYPEVIGLTGAQLVTAWPLRRRKVRRRRRYLHLGAGFVCVNDGPALALQLARVLPACPPPAEEGR